MTTWFIYFSIGNKGYEVEAYGDDHCERILAQIKDAKGKVKKIWTK
jgi:hypothetical protein